MRASGTIAIVASDQGLLRSLVFALEVEGFSVVPAARWSPEFDAVAEIDCIVVDADALRRQPHLRSAIKSTVVPVVFLADGMIEPPERADIYPLSKPFQGADLTALLRQLVSA